MYFISLISILTLIVQSTIQATTIEKTKCIGLNCSKDIPKVPIRSVNTSLSGQNLTKTCPDNQTICEDDETCCSLNIGGYGCCDPDHSRCCGDGVHCCPNERTPVKPKIHRISLTKNNGRSTVGQLNRVDVNLFNSSSVKAQCSGSSFECPTQTTCCKDSDGDWACCNFPNATCCSDGLHCCPSGYRCRLDILKCVLSVKKKSIFSPR